MILLIAVTYQICQALHIVMQKNWLTTKKKGCKFMLKIRNKNSKNSTNSLCTDHYYYIFPNSVYIKNIPFQKEMITLKTSMAFK
jgi:hypothetical protein